MTDTALMEVRLIGLPLDLQRTADAHYDALMREFELIRQSDSAGETVPVRLLDLVDELTTRLDEFAEQPRAVLEAALESGEAAVDLVFQVPDDIVEACEQLLELLDKVDAYCSAGEHLVTLSSSPAVRAYREWFLGEFIEQGAGRSPTPWSARAEPPNRPASSASTPIETPVNNETHEPESERWPTTVEGDKATVMLAGELDLALAPSLRNHLNQVHSNGVRHFTLDAAGVSFIDSVGLSVLLALYRRCREEDGTVSLVRPSPSIRRTLEISGLLDVLNVS
ncbi:MAG TPA: STAS domain-containing protein [Acidimicrobiales bacterium]|nr:STAS domain-containing protein [Acidimicrobiales bacterium]